MRVLLLGGTGQLGREILLRTGPDRRVTAPMRQELDLAVPGGIDAFLGSNRFELIVNAAAYTAVDQAEAERDAAFMLNAEVPGRLAKLAAERSIPIIHVSTDYVFDGRKGYPYLPDDPVAPLGVYGASKEAGERSVRAHNPRHVILRTSWLHSPFGTNFVKTMLRLAGERDILRVVDDQRGCPTAAADLAAACLTIADRIVADPDAAPYGTYHFANAGETTWCGFAHEIFSLAKLRLRRIPEVVAITTDDFPTPARRPADSRLDCSETVARFAVAQRNWRAALAATLDRLLP